MLCHRVVHTGTSHKEELLAKSAGAPVPGKGPPTVLQAPALLPSLSSNPSSLLTCRGAGSSRAGRGTGAFLEEGTLDRVGHEDSFSGDRESRAEQVGCHGEGRLWALPWVEGGGYREAKQQQRLGLLPHSE